jgi:predicted enzyme related to lactoylglutathione lyase
MGFAPARTFQEALRKSGIPLTQLAVPNVQETYERLTRQGVVFHAKPMEMGPTIIAMFDDTCGNVIQLIQQ